MKPISFPEKNRVLGKPPSMTDDECGALPVYGDGERTISCWRPTWRERLSILFFGLVWLHVWFGVTQPPVALDGRRNIFVHEGTRRWWRGGPWWWGARS